MPAALALGAISWQGSALQAAPNAQREWSLADLVAVPEIEDVVISANGNTVAYLLRCGDEVANRPVFELHVFDIRKRQDRVIATSAFLAQVRTIPGRENWSILGDFGEGVQLYELENDGTRRPLVVSSTRVLVGSAEGAEPGYSGTPPVQIGVASYSWSPDGTRLFYSTLEARETVRRAISNEEVNLASARRRSIPTVKVKFFIRTGGGKDVPMFEREGTDRVARHLGAMPIWGDEYIEYGIQGDDNPDPAVRRYRWNFLTRQSSPAPVDSARATQATVIGPSGGKLVTVRQRGARHLIERSEGGTVRDYGPTMLALSDGRSPGHWRSPDGAYALIAVRDLERDKYALLRLDRNGRTKLIQTRESLTHCAFNASAVEGVCIHEGLTRAPELVAVSARTGKVRPLTTLSPSHERLTKFAYERRIWINAFGYKASGFVMFPRGFQKKGRYPTIIITHGSDADERFAAPDLQWSYPIQIFLERGFVVVAMNDPSTSQSDVLEDAQSSWNNCDGKTPPSELQRLIWLNAIESFRSAIDELDKEGIIDRERIGIAGYSAGSQMTNVAVTQTDLFKAASSGDGSYLEPAAYRYLQCSYRAVFGGAPGDEKAFANYRALAPSYRAREATAAVLQQLAEPRAGAMDFYVALRAANVPAEATLYPGETPASDESHLFHIPSNRRAAMEENVEWFEYWLKGIVPKSASDGDRARRWEAMRQQQLTRSR